MNTRNSPVTFQNTYIKPYNCLTEHTIVNNLKKTADEEIPQLFDYPNTEKSHRQSWPWKSYFINDLINKIRDIFISHGEHADYKLVLKLCHDKIITNPSNPFEQSDKTETESLLVNGVLLLLQYDFNK